MKNQFQLMKAVMKYLIILLTPVLLIAYTNFDSVDSDLVTIKSESQEVYNFLKSNPLNGDGINLLYTHKEMITNTIARITRAPDCQSLLTEDPFATPGNFVLYPDGSIENAVIYYCGFIDGTISDVIELGRLDEIKDGCVNGHCLSYGDFHTELICGSGKDQPQICSFQNILDAEVVREFSNGKCELDKTYGFDASGLWVNGYCKARFKIKVMPTPGLVAAKNGDPLWQARMNNYSEILKCNSVNVGFQSTLAQKRGCKDDFPLADKIDNLTKLYKSKIRQHFGLREVIRENHSNKNVIKNKETKQEALGEKFTQKLIHVKQLLSCNDLIKTLSDEKSNKPSMSSPFFHATLNGRKSPEKDLTKNLKIFTGSYYFYQIGVMGARVPQSHATYCDFQRLIPLTNTLEKETFIESEKPTLKYNTNQLITAKVSSYSESLKIPINQTMNNEDQTVRTIGYYVAKKCLAKKDVQYLEHGKYSFFEEDDLGDILYKAAGKYFCFKSGEEFKYSFEHLNHGLAYSKISAKKNKWRGTPIEVIEYDEIYLVKAGGEPLKNSVGGAVYPQRQITSHCISFENAKKNMEENDRPVLLKDSLRYFQRVVVKKGDKYYCPRAADREDESAYTEKSLVYAYRKAKGAQKIAVEAFTSAVNAGDVIGRIDGTQLLPSVGKLKIWGWACQKNLSESIKISLYAGAQKIGNKQLFSKVTDKTSGEPIRALCGNSGSSHRFEAKLDIGELVAHSNKPIYAYGTSFDGKTTTSLSRSGVEKIPLFQFGATKGHVDSLKKVGQNIEVRGWACQKGFDGSVKIQLLSKQNLLNSTVLKTQYANMQSEGAVSQACETNGQNHRFLLKLPYSKVQNMIGARLSLLVVGYGAKAKSEATSAGPLQVP